MPLPIVRKTGANMSFIPDSDAISKCMAVSTTPEAADYLFDELTEVFKSAKSLAESVINSVMETVNDYVNYVKLAHAGGDEWGGKTPPSSFQNYQEGLAAITAKIMRDKKVELDYAIGDDSQFLRGYTSDGIPLDEESITAMDKSFNAWLATNQLYSKGGTIYESTPEGEIKMDGDNPIKVKADDFRQLIQDPVKGFEKYMVKTNKSMQMSIYPQEYQAAEEPSPSPDASSSSRSQGG
jgi:hypothetical protein